MREFILPIIFTLVTVTSSASLLENVSNDDASIFTQPQFLSVNESIVDIVKSTKLLVKKTCQQEYSSACLKLDLIKIMDRLSLKKPLPLLPGVTLIQKPTESPSYRSLPLQDSPRLDNHLYKRINSYLRSLSLNVQLLDENVLRSLKKFGEGALTYFANNNTLTGRKKTGLKFSFWTIGLLSGGALLAMGLSTMAAMAGKALVTSLLALMLAAFAALRGQNDHKNSTTYEIITRPVITHGKHTDAVADAHVMTTAHAGPSSYTYRRSVDHGQPQDYSFIPIIAATRS